MSSMLRLQFIVAVLFSAATLSAYGLEAPTPLKIHDIALPWKIKMGEEAQTTAVDEGFNTIVFLGRQLIRPDVYDKILQISRLDGEGTSARYKTPVPLAENCYADARTVALSPDGRWLALGLGHDAEQGSSPLKIIDLPRYTGCSPGKAVQLMSVPSEGRYVLSFNGNSDRLAVGQPFATSAQSSWGEGPSQGFVAEYTLSGDASWSLKDLTDRYLFGSFNRPNYYAGFGSSFIVSADGSTKAIMVAGEGASPGPYSRNPATPKLVLQKSKFPDAIFDMEKHNRYQVEGNRLAMDSSGRTAVSVVSADGANDSDQPLLYSFDFRTDNWHKSEYKNIDFLSCFPSDRPASQDSVTLLDVVMSEGRGRLLVTVNAWDRATNDSPEGRTGICVFSREGAEDWELMTEASQTISAALHNSIDERFIVDQRHIHKLQGNSDLTKILVSSVAYAIVLELKWDELEAASPGLPVWLLYEASKS